MLSRATRKTKASTKVALGLHAAGRGERSPSARTNLGAYPCSETEAAGGRKARSLSPSLSLPPSLPLLSLSLSLSLSHSGLWDLKIP